MMSLFQMCYITAASHCTRGFLIRLLFMAMNSVVGNSNQLNYDDKCYCFLISSEHFQCHILILSGISTAMACNDFLFRDLACEAGTAYFSFSFPLLAFPCLYIAMLCLSLRLSLYVALRLSLCLSPVFFLSLAPLALSFACGLTSCTSPCSAFWLRLLLHIALRLF